MLVEQELEGEWWVPGEGVERRPGTLHFKSDGFRLRTYGSVVRLAEPGEAIFERVTAPVAWGALYERHREVTLLGVSGFRPWSSEGIYVWRVEAALVGGHLPADAVFDLVAVRTEHVDEWAGAIAVVSETTVGDDGRVTTASARVERAVLDTAVITDMATVEVECQSRGRSAERQFTVAVKAQFRLYPARPMELAEVLREAAVLRDLVRLSVGRPCAIEELEVRSAKAGEDGRSVWATVLQRNPALLVARPTAVDGFDILCGGTRCPAASRRACGLGANSDIGTGGLGRC